MSHSSFGRLRRECKGKAIEFIFNSHFFKGYLPIIPNGGYLNPFEPTKLILKIEPCLWL